MLAYISQLNYENMCFFIEKYKNVVIILSGIFSVFNTQIYFSAFKVYSECCCFDEYPILQYPFEVLGLIFSVNDYKLGKALSKLTAKQREIILAYYFTDLNLRGISHILGVAQQSASFHHVKGLQKSRKTMEADNK